MTRVASGPVVRFNLLQNTLWRSRAPQRRVVVLVRVGYYSSPDRPLRPLTETPG